MPPAGVAILGAVLRIGVLTEKAQREWALLSAAALLVVGSAASFTIPIGRRGADAQMSPASVR
jgi:hypothetical protein